MFRVPKDPEIPTFDDAFKVSFWKWLTSKSDIRHEWMRRRNVAARLAGANHRADVTAKRNAKRAELKMVVNTARAELATDWKDRMDAAHAINAERDKRMAARKAAARARLRKNVDDGEAERRESGH